MATPAPPSSKPSRAAPPAAGGDNTRPASLWPESTQAAALHSVAPSAFSRFDPLADDQQRDASRVMASFDVCHPALGLRAVLLVQAVVLVAALVASSSWLEAGLHAGQGTFVGLLASLVWLVTLCALKRPLRTVGPGGRAAVVVLLGAAAALLAWLPLWWLDVSPSADGPRPLGVALAGGGLALLLWGWLDLRSRIWQPAQTQARLQELQARIRPHFLFNALNTALALVRVDPERAESVLEDLSALFRVALADAGSSVALSEEIELAQRYLAIEQVRFGSRLKVRWEIDPRIGRARVPPLVLQPLIENAVRHGIEPALQGGKVIVEGKVQRGQAVLVVSNTVPDEPSIPGAGIALRNVRERLRLLHDVAGECDTWREGEAGRGDGASFHARIIVPLA